MGGLGDGWDLWGQVGGWVGGIVLGKYITWERKRHTAPEQTRSVLK